MDGGKAIFPHLCLYIKQYFFQKKVVDALCRFGIASSSHHTSVETMKLLPGLFSEETRLEKHNSISPNKKLTMGLKKMQEGRRSFDPHRGDPVRPTGLEAEGAAGVQCARQASGIKKPLKRCFPPQKKKTNLNLNFQDEFGHRRFKEMSEDASTPDRNHFDRLSR